MKKGYTLIELLAVIFVVGMIASLALLSISKKSSQFKTISSQKVEELIISSAKSYISSKEEIKNKLKAGDTVNISYETLYNAGYLPSELKDIKSSNKISSSKYKDYCVQINYIENYKYEYSIVNSSNCE